MYSGALCEDTSATAPGSAFEYPPCTRYNPPPFLLRRPERKGEEPKAQGDGEVCRGGGCKVNEANDNRIYSPSNRALGGCRLRHTYCHEGLQPYIRVHFAKTQVQLPLDQIGRMFWLDHKEGGLGLPGAEIEATIIVFEIIAVVADM